LPIEYCPIVTWENCCWFLSDIISWVMSTPLWSLLWSTIVVHVHDILWSYYCTFIVFLYITTFLWHCRWILCYWCKTISIKNVYPVGLFTYNYSTIGYILVLIWHYTFLLAEIIIKYNSCQGVPNTGINIWITCSLVINIIHFNQEPPQ